MTDQQQGQKISKADAAWFRKTERVFGEDLKRVAREGNHGQLFQLLLGHGQFLERHPEYLGVK